MKCNTSKSFALPFRIVCVVTEDRFEKAAAELAQMAKTPLTQEQLYRGIALETQGGAQSKQNVLVSLCSQPQQVKELVSRHPVDVILLDNRGDAPSGDFASTVAGTVLPELLANVRPGKTPPRGSFLVILPDNEFTASHAYAVGTLQLGGVLVEPRDIQHVLEAACRTRHSIEKGSIALCIAGGGIEGMFYELGVLRALDEHLEGCSVTDFEIFSGISAGAILGAFLANGVPPSDVADALHGRKSKVDPITRSILFNPNLGEIARRVIASAGDLMRGKWLTHPIDTALKVAPNALFSGEKLREYLEKEFSKNGLTNDFRQLDKTLLIGATDQDKGTHVTFGTLNNTHVPIAKAVRASCAMTPYYNPENIDGRYFVDGIFTRTLDIDAAIAAGARMIICIDPMTPVQVENPGYVSGQGGLFNTVQSVKSMIRTRLSEVIDRIEEFYPDVTVFVFSPTPKDMEHMSGTLMRFFYRTETEEMAFESASARIKNEFDWLAADFAKYGFELKR